MTYTITGNHFSTVVPLPVSVSTLTNWWTKATVNLSTIIAELVNRFNVVIENVPFFIKEIKEKATVYAKFVAEQILVILEYVKTLVPKYINELFPVFNDFVEFLMNTEVAKFLVAKIDELIKMYPTQFNAIKAYFERFIEFVFNYITLVYTKMMEIPVIRKFVNYIWDLIYHKDMQTTMVIIFSKMLLCFSYNTDYQFNQRKLIITVDTIIPNKQLYYVLMIFISSRFPHGIGYHLV